MMHPLIGSPLGVLHSNLVILFATMFSNQGCCWHRLCSKNHRIVFASNGKVGGFGGCDGLRWRACTGSAWSCSLIKPQSGSVWICLQLGDSFLWVKSRILEFLKLIFDNCKSMIINDDLLNIGGDWLDRWGPDMMICGHWQLGIRI